MNAISGEVNILAMSGMSPMSSEFHPTSEFNQGAFNGTDGSDNIAAKLERFRHELKKSSEAVEQLRKRTRDLSEEKHATPRDMVATGLTGLSKNMFSNKTGDLSQQLAPISNRSNATSNFGVTKTGDQDVLRSSGIDPRLEIFNRPESFSLETTTDKNNMFCYSKGNSQSVLSMKMDKYEAVNPVVEQATLESRLESRCEESYR